jgi:hypothetical protein
MKHLVISLILLAGCDPFPQLTTRKLEKQNVNLQQQVDQLRKDLEELHGCVINGHGGRLQVIESKLKISPCRRMGGC